MATTFSEGHAPVYVGDSREGWAEALRELVLALYAGKVCAFDTRDVRPEGAVLKTFGGLASGPEPLHRLQAFLVDMFKGAAGRKLTPLECHDMVCNIGEVVVVGGVRRCAALVLHAEVRVGLCLMGRLQAPCLSWTEPSASRWPSALARMFGGARS